MHAIPVAGIRICKPMISAIFANAGAWRKSQMPRADCEYCHGSCVVDAHSSFYMMDYERPCGDCEDETMKATCAGCGQDIEFRNKMSMSFWVHVSTGETVMTKTIDCRKCEGTGWMDKVD